MTLAIWPEVLQYRKLDEIIASGGMMVQFDVFFTLGASENECFTAYHLNHPTKRELKVEKQSPLL